MLEIIIKLLIAMGLYSGQGPTKNIVVIDSNTGACYNILTTNGAGNSVTNPNTGPEVLYLVHNANGTYSLVHH